MMPSEKSMEKAREIYSDLNADYEADLATWEREKDIASIATALDSAIAETREECAAIAETWKSALRPGSDQRLAGHHEARREIASAIRATGKESER